MIMKMTEKGLNVKMERNIAYPDYENSIANLACSILKHFGVEPPNVTLKMADTLLAEQEYQNIVVFLLDGMGEKIVEENLESGGFFRRHMAGSYSSVFPSTTVAATTSINCGLFPSQHSWLGWDCYFKAIDQNVTVFRNINSETGEPAAEYNVSRRYCPYRSVTESIKENGGQAYYVSPFAYPNPENVDEVCNEVERLCGMNGKKYVYAYWTEPDSVMHKTGCYSQSTKEMLRQIEERIEDLCNRLSNTLVLVTADHGHINTKGAALEEQPELMECLVRMPSIEPRAVNFFVKKGYEKKFEKEFEKQYGEEFWLLKHEDVKKQKLFGPGPEHPCFDDMLGDYLAVAVGNTTLFNMSKDKEKFIGVHAGLLKDEMRIPLVAVKRKG